MQNDFNLDDLKTILSVCPEYSPNHPLGRPFMSAYQVAIRFADAHRNHHLVRTLPLGGEGTGQHQSLAQRIARFLSAAAQDPGTDVEGAFISHQNINEVLFDNNGSLVRVSGLNGPGHSIFRLRPLH